jgi:hypothetical protein
MIAALNANPEPLAAGLISLRAGKIFIFPQVHADRRGQKYSLFNNLTAEFPGPGGSGIAAELQGNQQRNCRGIAAEFL